MVAFKPLVQSLPHEILISSKLRILSIMRQSSHFAYLTRHTERWTLFYGRLTPPCLRHARPLVLGTLPMIMVGRYLRDHFESIFRGEAIYISHLTLEMDTLIPTIASCTGPSRRRTFDACFQFELQCRNPRVIAFNALPVVKSADFKFPHV